MRDARVYAWRVFAGIVSIRSYSCLASAAGSGGEGVAGIYEAGDESPSPSTPPAEPPNTVRRDVGNRRGNCRPEAGKEIMDSVGVRRWTSELPGRADLVDSGASSAVGLRVNRPNVDDIIVAYMHSGIIFDTRLTRGRMSQMLSRLCSSFLTKIFVRSRTLFLKWVASR